MEDKKHSILEGTITVIYGFLVMFLTTMGLFFFRGIEEAELFEKATFYWTFLAISLITILSLAIMEYLVSTGFLSKDKFGWAKLYIWETDESILGSIGLEKFITVKRVIHFSIILALLFGLLGTLTQTFFVSLPPYELQVSETGQLILNTEPAALSETLTFVVLLSFIYGLGRWWFEKLKIYNVGSMFVLHLISVILMTVFWVAVHSARYGSTTAIGFTAIFGFFGSFLTVLFGTPIPWYFWHVGNNVFLKANEIFVRSNVQIFIISLLVLYIGGLIGFSIYKFIKNK